MKAAERPKPEINAAEYRGAEPNTAKRRFVSCMNRTPRCIPAATYSHAPDFDAVAYRSLVPRSRVIEQNVASREKGKLATKETQRQKKRVGVTEFIGEPVRVTLGWEPVTDVDLADFKIGDRGMAAVIPKAQWFIEDALRRQNDLARLAQWRAYVSKEIETDKGMSLVLKPPFEALALAALSTLAVWLRHELEANERDEDVLADMDNDLGFIEAVRGDLIREMNARL